MHKLFVSIIVLLQFIPFHSVLAYDNSWPTEEELWGLPEYCRPLPFIGGRPGTYDMSSPIWRKWYPLLGEGYKHTHHYCNGLNFTNRSYRVRGDSIEVRSLLKSAVKEFDYVLVHSPQDFVLAPEVLAKRARAYVKLKDRTRAVQDLQTAINRNPEYMPAYADLIYLLIENGKMPEARKLYDEGIKIKPDSTSLEQFKNKFSAK